MKKRSRWLFIVAAIVLVSITQSLPNVYAEERSVHILNGEEQAEQITIEQEEKQKLKALASGLEVQSYQWQILMSPENDLWVDIADKTEQECEVSYAMVKSLLDDSNSAYLRCAIDVGDDEPVYSEPACITVSMGINNANYDFMSMEVAEAALNYKNAKAIALANDEYATITINYLDYYSHEVEQIEKAIYSPYTASVEKGTDFSQTVLSPTFLGFAPFYAKDLDGVIDDDASKLELNYTAVNADIIINIYYKPIDVNFAIRYFFQNINDDLYTENVDLYHQGKAETGTIISNDYLMEHAGDTTGFQKLYHYPENVAADGSTVFECYYDRNYYLIQFDMAGGYGVDPIYARYDSPFIVNDPIRHGYTFNGWKLVKVDLDADGNWEATLPTGINPSMVDKIPNYSCYYEAQWIAKTDVKVDIVYWLQDANDPSQYNYWGRYELLNQVAGTTLNGKKFENYASIADGFGNYASIADDLDKYEKRYSVFNSTKSDVDVEVRGDGSTTVNVYYDRKEYTLKFYYAATETNATETIYKVVGGTTYCFGQELGKSEYADDEIEALDYSYIDYDKGNQWGKIKQLPELKDGIDSSKYTWGNDKSLRNDNIVYHYISFTAKYGADITDLWPCDVFESVTRTSANTHGNWSGTEAVMSAWNGEYNVYYSQQNSNETIKGKYEKLDYQLLFDTDKGFADSSTVSYLCFWENGANISWSIPRLWVYKIWVPVLAGEDIEGFTTKEQDGVTYKLIASYDTCDDSTDINQQTQVALEGYEPEKRTYERLTNPDKDKYVDAYIANFYYKNTPYQLTFDSSGTKISDKGGTLGYGELLENNAMSAFFEPEYPSNLEEDAYEFAGWYTSPGGYTGTEFGNFVYDAKGRYDSSDFDNWTMPANDLILYAKWVPVIHTVKFFVDYDAMKQHELDNASATPHFVKNDIEHGTVVGSVDTPTKMGDGSLPLIFAGWFYIDGGAKRAFTPLDMPVNRDLNIFADWSSNSPQPYKIQYLLESDKTIKVAEDTVGYAYGGSTRTFIPKAGNPFNQLYENYSDGYFPTIGSHSITMEYEPDDQNPVHNVYEFYYVHAENIAYTVRYVNKETNTVMKEVSRETTSSVVTERFEPFTDMVPDAFYKRLVLAVEYDEATDSWIGSKDNVITFYYTPNEKSAYYAVHFMLEKLDATEETRKNYATNGTGGYEEAGTHLEGVGDIGDNIPITPQAFEGFELISDKAVTKIDGQEKPCGYGGENYQIKVTPNGTELYLFYERLSYNYSVHYYLYNTSTSVDSENFPSEVKIARYGATVEETAKTIPGYTCVSAETQTMTIRADEEQNAIIFYYSPIEYRIEYIVITEPVSETDGGTLSNTLEVIDGDDPVVGSIPKANKYYEFAGWYLDEECTQDVDEFGNVDKDTGEFKPNKAKLDAKNGNQFYAKFVRLSGDFTITRTNAETDQVYVYEIENDESGEKIYVTITGKDSVTIHELPFGNYTITQQNSWSWRYVDEAISGYEHKDANGSTVEFEKPKDSSKSKWLNGNSELIRNERGE